MSEFENTLKCDECQPVRAYCRNMNCKHDPQKEIAALRKVAEKAEEERDAMLIAFGFKPGALDRSRDVVLKELRLVRPEMVKARRKASEYQHDSLVLQWVMEDAPGLLVRVWKMFTEKRSEALRLTVELADLRAQRDRYRWIPVREKLPEDGQEIVAIRSNGGKMYGRWNRLYKIFLNDISYWMPLPSAPEQGDPQ